MSNLVKTGDSNLEHKFQVAVVSEAQPDTELLLSVRYLIQQKSDLQEVFTVRQIDQAFLQERLRAYLNEDTGPELLANVVQFLADEHEQLGGDNSILVISPDTGRALAKLGPEDFYQPEMVPRESGRMVVPEPKVKPEIASLLAVNVHESEREKQVKSALLSRAPSRMPAPLVHQRTRLATRGGRGELAAELYARLPKLIEGATGSAAEFFRRFPFGAPELGELGHEVFPVDVTARVRSGVQDGTTLNLHFDQIAASSAVITAQWARVLGSLILTKAAPWASAEVETLEGEGFYLASPDSAPYVHGRTLVVDGPDGIVVHLPGDPGKLEVKDYSARWRDVHDKWTLEAFLTGTLYLNWSKLKVYRLSEVALTGVIVETLH